MRVKRGYTSRRRHKRRLKLAEGFRGRRSDCFKLAKRSVEKALQYAYRDRRAKKRDFRGLWIQRISAACKNEGTSYSQLIGALIKNGVGLDRKVLAEIALRDPASFKAILDSVKASLN